MEESSGREEESTRTTGCDALSPYLVSWPAPPSLHIVVYAFGLLQLVLLGDFLTGNK